MAVPGYAPFSTKTFENPTVGLVLHVMCQLAWQGHKSQSVRNLAEVVVKKTQSGDYASECNAWLMYISSTMRYALDPVGVELTQWPEGLLRPDKMIGDCDDQAVCSAAALQSLGHQCYFCVVGFTSAPMPSHVFVVVDGRGKGPCVIDSVAKWQTPEMLRKVTFMKLVSCADGVDMNGEQVGNAYGLGMTFQGWGGWPG